MSDKNKENLDNYLISKIFRHGVDYIYVCLKQLSSQFPSILRNFLLFLEGRERVSNKRERKDHEW